MEKYEQNLGQDDATISAFLKNIAKLTEGSVSLEKVTLKSIRPQNCHNKDLKTK